MSPPVSDGQANSQEYQTANGQKWIAMSRPPKEMWDRLPCKDMGNYLKEHMRKFWKGV